ncbi:MAG: PilN domain-containing protein [Nitrospiraceae bacterium]|nr:PilN domain-containing protein [Nitrospiraceae bacterium]
MNIAGLNMEGDRLQAAVISRGIFPPGPVKRIHFEEAPLPADTQGKSSAVREMLARLKERFNVKAVVLGFENWRFSHHVIELPAMKREDLKGALAFELEKHLPLMPEEYAYDFIERKQENGSLKILVFAIRTESISWALEAARAAGVKIAGLRNSFIEMLNEFLTEKKKKRGIFVYAGKKDAYTAFFSDGKPGLIKTFAAAEAQAEVERLKLADPADVYFCGEGVFNQALAYENVPLVPAYAVAHSVSKKRPVRMDFAPAGTSGLASAGSPRAYTYALWGMAGFCVLVYLLTPVLAYYKDYSAYRKVEAQISGLKKSASGLLESRRSLDDIRQRKEFLRGFQSGMNKPVKVLSELSRVLPGDAWLSSFVIEEKGKVEIAGFSNNAAMIIEPLENSPMFRKVEFSSPVVSRDGIERFSIKMDIGQ